MASDCGESHTLLLALGTIPRMPWVYDKASSTTASARAHVVAASLRACFFSGQRLLGIKGVGVEIATGNEESHPWGLSERVAHHHRPSAGLRYLMPVRS